MSSRSAQASNEDGLTKDELARLPANFAALTPVSFLVRAAAV